MPVYFLPPRTMDDTTPSTGSDGTELIDIRKAREQAALIEQLRKVPVISMACERVGISRQTYYRWRHESDAFAKDTDEAIADGTNFVGDMAQSMLFSGIRDGNLGAITYFLTKRHPAYSNRMEVTAKIKHDDSKLTPEQEQAVEEALRLTSFDEPPLSTSLPSSPYGTNSSPEPGVSPDTRNAEHTAPCEDSGGPASSGV